MDNLKMPPISNEKEHNYMKPLISCFVSSPVLELAYVMKAQTTANQAANFIY